MAQDPRILTEKAEKALSSASSGWWLIGGRTEKYEEAVDLFTQAANAFRYQDHGREAGIMYERAAEVQKNRLNSPDDAANTLIEASKVYEPVAPEDAVRVLRQAIQRFTLDTSHFRRAAPYQATIGNICEKSAIEHHKLAFQAQNLANHYQAKAKDLDGKELQECKNLHSRYKETAITEGRLAKEAGAPAIEAYSFGARWFEGDRAPSNANKLWLKAAELLALQDEFQKAADLFEKVATSSIINNTMKYSVKDYLLQAGICQLAIDDMVATTRALGSYTELDPSFASTMEYRLLVDLIEAYERSDSDAFGNILHQYNEMKPLDDWKVKLFLRIKRRIETKEDNEEENFN